MQALKHYILFLAFGMVLFSCSKKEELESKFELKNQLEKKSALGADDFVTTWQTTVANESITIPTSGGGYNYSVNWGDGTPLENGFSGDTSHTYFTAGVYTVRISGDFPQIYFKNTGDINKILSVEQWGIQIWRSMHKAFYGCSNLVINAVDKPNLTQVTDLSWMFYRASSFNQPLETWDVSSVTNMSAMFTYATSFNQPLDNWDVSNVTDMTKMFDVASNFNQPLNTWDVSKVTSMQAMLSFAPSFNQPLDNWDVSSVTNFQYMFYKSSSFNQPLNTWDVSNAQLMRAMFYEASSFDQTLNLWDISNVTTLRDFLKSVNLSTANYDAILDSWSQRTLLNNVLFDGGNSQYCTAASARQSIINNSNWVITDGGVNCGPADDFVTTWQTTTAGESITIPTTGSDYDYSIDWGDGSTVESGNIGDVTHVYGTPGTHTIIISGDFPQIYFTGSQDKEKILSVDQWGTQVWRSMIFAFSGCSNLVLNASDVPDLSQVTDMSGMFNGATTFNQSINSWDVSNVTSMNSLFREASSFDQPLDSWDVSNVEQMAYMFQSASVFNQPLNSWNVSSVSNMSWMFAGATVFDQPLNSWDVSNINDINHMFYAASSFNQPLHSWDVSKITNMESTFREAFLFNQPLNSWDVSKVTNMKSTFSSASEFDQPLNLWNVSSVIDMTDLFKNVELSSENYDRILNAWRVQDLQNEVTLDAGNSQYCYGENSRELIIVDLNWTINDGGKNCPDISLNFVTTWQTIAANESITIPTNGNGYLYAVDWGDGSPVETGFTGDATHMFVYPGTYSVVISGAFPQIYFNNSGDKNKILSVKQWGNQVWRSMESAFFGCSKLEILATDAPDLSQVTDVSEMFAGAASFNQPLNHWDVSNVIFMDWMLSAASFNQPLNNWNLSKVTHIYGMFYGAASFNQPLDSWDVSKAINTNGMFYGASSFNQSLSSWNVSNVTDMHEMFYGATAFSQPLGAWNISTVTNMSTMFSNINLTIEDYDATLISWAQQNLQNDVVFDGGNSQYCTSASARQSMIDNFNWTITDGGLNCENATPTDAILSQSSLIENRAAQSLIGTLTAVDDDLADLHIFALNCDVAGADDQYFSVAGEGIKSTQAFDFENPIDANQDNNYEICIQVDDQKGGVFDKEFSITIIDDGLLDSDGDGAENVVDSDDDNDGISDVLEDSGFDDDIDNDGIINSLDLDSDGDGVLDTAEGSGDLDNDGIINSLDKNDTDGPQADYDGEGLSNAVELILGTHPFEADSDKDGISDGFEVGNEVDNPFDSDDDGIIDALDTDSDDDGISDKIEGQNDLVNDGKANYMDLDSDGDGLTDSLESAFDADGDGLANYLDTDSDNNGILDQNEGTLDSDGDGIIDALDLNDADGEEADSDADGLTNKFEVQIKSNPYVNDTDGDGVLDGEEIGNNLNRPLDSDGDGVFDILDLDDDGDGIFTAKEISLQIKFSGHRDVIDDTDNIPVNLDLDSDGDGLSDYIEGVADSDNDGAPNFLDIDSDGDGFLDKDDDMLDDDFDGIPNVFDPDDSDGPDADPDGDGLNIREEVRLRLNAYSDDTDDDGIDDGVEVGADRNNPRDSDADGISDALDEDDDNDEILTIIENSQETLENSAIDSDDNGVLDIDEGQSDLDGDGVFDFADADNDNDGKDDIVDGITTDDDDDGFLNYMDSDDSDGPLGDADNDGLSNAAELANKTNPMKADTDDDGLTDGEEVFEHGTFPLKADSDNDGINDGDEIENGSDPLDANDPNMPQMEQDAGSNVIDAGADEPLVEADGDSCACDSQSSNSELEVAVLFMFCILLRRRKIEVNS